MKTFYLASAAALAVISAPLASYSQNLSDQPYSETVTITDFGAFADARIDLVKSTLQLKADQEQYWPAIEQAIRSRSKQRVARLETVGARISEIKSEGLMESLRNTNPIEFMNRRADALEQRAASLKQLANAWQPLYETLSPEQKRRLALLAVYAIHEMRDAVQQRRLDAMHEDED